jgi:hypothetical protein
MEDNVAPDSWALMPFVKADSSNPILMPDTSSFYDPVWKKRIAWEKKMYSIRPSWSKMAK